VAQRWFLGYTAGAAAPVGGTRLT